MSPPVEDAMKKLRSFMFERVYTNQQAKSEEGKAELLVETLYDYYLHHIDKISGELLVDVYKRQLHTIENHWNQST